MINHFAKISLVNFSKTKIFLTIFIFITNSIALYAFLYLLREAATLSVFIGISATYYCDIPILIDLELLIYNFIIALISTIFGLNTALSFVFNKPRKPFQYTKRARLAILNDQRVLIYFFLFWLLMISEAFFGIMSITLSELSYFEIQDNILIILFGSCIVLFLRTILTIKRYVPSIKNKHFVLTAIFIVVLSALMSLYNFSYHSANIKSIESGNIFRKYSIEIPSSFFCKGNYRLSLIEEIYITKSADYEEETVIIYKGFGDVEEFGIEDIGKIVTYSKLRRNSNDAIFVTYLIFADKDLNIKHIRNVLSELKTHEAVLISFAAKPHLNEFHQRFYYCGINYLNRAFELPDDASLPPLETINQSFYINSNYTFRFNDNYYNWELFPGFFSSLYFNNPENVILIYLNESLTYGQFILMMSKVWEIVHDARDILSLSKHGLNYQDLNSYEADEIRRIFPIKTFFLFN